MACFLRFLGITVCGLAILGAAHGGEPQAAPDGTVSAVGLVELKKQPELLRVQIDLLAKGKTLKDALAKLKDRRDAVKLRLTAMQALPESIAFADPTLGSDKSDQQKQMEMMVAQRLQAKGGKQPPKAKEPPPVVVSTVLRFDLPLKATGAEELLLLAETLQQKIKDADLSGLKEFEKLSPQDTELMEEAQFFQQRGGGMEEPKRGEPLFMFVANIGDDEMARARADAFKKARLEATNLAKAAGAQLGALRRLESQNNNAPDEAFGGYNPRYYARQQQMLMLQAGAGAQQPEAVGMQPGQVTYRVAVTAAFTLKTPAP